MKLFIHYIMLKLSNQYITNINIRLYIKEYDNVIKFKIEDNFIWTAERESIFVRCYRTIVLLLNCVRNEKHMNTKLSDSLIC